MSASGFGVVVGETDGRGVTTGVGETIAVPGLTAGAVAGAGAIVPSGKFTVVTSLEPGCMSVLGSGCFKRCISASRNLFSNSCDLK